MVLSRPVAPSSLDVSPPSSRLLSEAQSCLCGAAQIEILRWNEPTGQFLGVEVVGCNRYIPTDRKLECHVAPPGMDKF